MPIWQGCFIIIMNKTWTLIQAVLLWLLDKNWHCKLIIDSHDSFPFKYCLHSIYYNWFLMLSICEFQFLSKWKWQLCWKYSMLSTHYNNQWNCVINCWWRFFYYYIQSSKWFYPSKMVKLFSYHTISPLIDCTNTSNSFENTAKIAMNCQNITKHIKLPKTAILIRIKS